jgi:hypothetical protein
VKPTPRVVGDPLYGNGGFDFEQVEHIVIDQDPDTALCGVDQTDGGFALSSRNAVLGCSGRLCVGGSGCCALLPDRKRDTLLGCFRDCRVNVHKEPDQRGLSPCANRYSEPNNYARRNAVVIGEHRAGDAARQRSADVENDR